MKAILARAFGGPEVLTLEDVPDPSAGQGRRKKYPPRHSFAPNTRRRPLPVPPSGPPIRAPAAEPVVAQPAAAEFDQQVYL